VLTAPRPKELTTVRLRAILMSVALTLTAASAMAVATNAAGTATVKARHAKLGTYVVDARGMSLYLFEKDKGRKSTCYGTCAKVWKPLTVRGAPKAGAGLKPSLLSTTRRTGGAKQVTYGGHPLYYYDDDHKSGQTKGQGVKEFGAKWYVVAPSGKKIDRD
jgi:predicted lipoprotein with Yx(FWY)xxD motif